MIDIKLGEAIDVLNERYEAMGFDPTTEFTIGNFASTEHRLLLSGFDLNLMELEAAAQQIEDQSPRLMVLAEKGELSPFSIWLQGLLIGLIAANRASAAATPGEMEQH